MKKLLLLSVATVCIFSSAAHAMDGKKSTPYTACMAEATKRLTRFTNESKNLSSAKAKKETEKIIWEIEFCKSIDFGSPEMSKSFSSQHERIAK